MSNSKEPPLRIWLPSLSRFPADHPLRSWLSRGDRQPDADARQRWLACFDGDVFPVPSAALTREHWAGDAGDAAWLSADPAWVQPDLNGVRLLACGRLGLSGADAELLAAVLRPLCAEAGLQLEITTPERWHLRLPEGLTVPTFAWPGEALGEDLWSHVPQGAAGRRWRMLLNELQVALHQHPLNRLRREQGLPPVNSLWLWGGGRLPASVVARVRGVIGDDPLLQALAARTGITAYDCKPSTLGHARPGWLIDVQDQPMTERMEWLVPLLRRQSVELQFAGGERYRVRPWHRWRCWR